jgi:hypothetical protein
MFTQEQIARWAADQADQAPDLTDEKAARLSALLGGAS